MVITCQGYTQQVCEGFPGGAVPLVTDGGVLQEAVAAAGNQTDKLLFNDRVVPQVTNVQLQELR